MSEDVNTNALVIPDAVLGKWQRMVEIIADILQVPTVIITKLELPILRAYRTNASRGNPVPQDFAFPLGGDDVYRGIYCEWVVTRQEKLSVHNAEEDKFWHRSLGRRFGLISYIGLPLKGPDGAVFGTICAMDFNAGKFTKTYERLLVHFKDLIESHLQLLQQQSIMERHVSALEEKDAQLMAHRDHLEEQVARRTQELANTNANLVLEIEERKKTEQALKESEERFRQLVENSLTGIAIICKDRFIYQNPEHARLLGPIPEYRTASFFNNIHSQDVDRVKGLYRRISTGRIRSLDIDFRFYPFCSDGKQRPLQWVQCRASRVLYNGGKAVFLNLMDITHTKELEHLMRIEDKMSSLGRVAAGIAHEIRNPLSAINMYLRALQTTLTDVDAAVGGNVHQCVHIIQKIQAAAYKIEAIIKRVMDFSRPTSPMLTDTSINQAIRRAVDLCAVTVRKAGIQLETQLSPELPDCKADPQMIEQVLLNLINNATHALTQKGGSKKICIASETDSHTVITKVSDSGVGVPTDMREKIFDPFFTTRKTGSGIGLSLVRRIIMDHGGSIELTSAALGGAEFAFKIPIHQRSGQQ